MGVEILTLGKVMDINIYDYNGNILYNVSVEKPIFIGEIIKNIPLDEVPFLENIDILKTLGEINKNFNLKAESIMLIDDDDDFLKVTSHFLIKLGHYVETFNHADSAYSVLSKFKNDRYNRLIIDNKMPDVSGSHLVKSIYELKIDAKISILTANIEDVPHSISSKYMIIQKPCNMINIVGAASKQHITKGNSI